MSADAEAQHRLQRPPDFTGARLERFGQVFLRHGLPVAGIAVLLLLVPQMRALLDAALEGLVARPVRYVGIGVGIALALAGYVWFSQRRLDRQSFAWLFYLLALSIWEEWVFRLAIPYFGQSLGVDLLVLVLVSNAAFGLLHYFTLRWKWHWCVAAFLGGLLLSRQFHVQFDLAQIIALHWIGTFLNTPRPPGRSRER